MTTTPASVVPKTMKAAIGTGFGDIDERVFVRDDWPTPVLPPPPRNKKKRVTGGGDDDEELLVRVLACATAPGDVRTLSGMTEFMQTPRDGFPYVIGSDVAGIVVQVQETSARKFKPGDYVVARFDEPRPIGGIAEYRVVKASLTEHCPASIDPIVACGLTASAMAAKRIVQTYITKGDNLNVLVIGASGAVGSSVLQYTKLSGGAKSIVAVSTQRQMCLDLGATEVIDYRTENWWELPKYHKTKFDLVFDMVNGNNWTVGANAGTAIHPNAPYVALLSGVATDIVARNYWDAFQVVMGMMGRMFWAYWNPYIPSWHVPTALALEDGDLRALLDDVVQGKLKPQVDSASPFEFTTQGVRQALKLQKSCHAHGKVVVKIAEKE